MNCSVIDIGANTIRLTIFAVNENKPVVLFNKKQNSGLANYNEDGILTEDGVKVLINALSKFKEILKYYPVDREYVFATASLRNVRNSSEILEKVLYSTGIDIDLLSDREEANLGFRGVLSSVKKLDDGITVDIGGGSTEIVYYRNQEVKEIFNLDDGCLSLHKKFVKGIMPKKSELNKMKKLIKEKSKGFNINNANLLVGMGGTIRSTGKILQELKFIDNKRVFHRDDVERLYGLLSEKDAKALDALMKIAPDRIHTLQSGLVILLYISKVFDVHDIHVSTYGLREGYVIDRFIDNTF